VTRALFDDAASAYVDAVGDAVAYNGEAVLAVFGAGWMSVESGAVRVSSRRPELYVRYASLPIDACAREDPPVGGDEVEVYGELFEVVTAKPDVENVGATLTLKKAC